MRGRVRKISGLDSRNSSFDLSRLIRNLKDYLSRNQKLGIDE